MFRIDAVVVLDVVEGAVYPSAVASIIPILGCAAIDEVLLREVDEHTRGPFMLALE